MWASGASVLHPDPPLRWFWERFHFSEEMREREGLPEITEGIKRNILDSTTSECMALMRQLSRRASTVTNFPSRVRKGKQSRMRRLTGEGLRNDHINTRRRALAFGCGD